MEEKHRVVEMAEKHKGENRATKTKMVTTLAELVETGIKVLPHSEWLYWCWRAGV